MKKRILSKSSALNKFKAYKDNPYIVKLENAIILDDDCDFVDNPISDIERQPFVKINVHALNKIGRLAKYSNTLFYYLIEKMDFNNYVHFDYLIDTKDIGYKGWTTPLRAVRELLENSIIVKSFEPNWYWVNNLIVEKGR